MIQTSLEREEPREDLLDPVDSTDEEEWPEREDEYGDDDESEFDESVRTEFCGERISGVCCEYETTDYRWERNNAAGGERRRMAERDR